jgi:putative transposase
MARLPEIANPQRKPYRSDLNNAEWEVLKPLMVAPKGFGHPVEVDFRSYSQSLLLRATHRMSRGNDAPQPTYTTVYGYFQKWQRLGDWQQLHDQIRQQLRTKLRLHEQSTVAIADSQSVKTTEKRRKSTVSMVARRLKDVSVISS